MTILVWKVKCDICGKEIDAIEETFWTRDEGHFCNECDNKL